MEGTESRELGEVEPPTPPAHTICSSALGLWSGTAGEEREQPFPASLQKGIPLGPPLAADSQGGVRGRQTMWGPGRLPGPLWTGVSLLVCFRPPALSRCIYQCELYVWAAAFLGETGFLGGEVSTCV